MIVDLLVINPSINRQSTINKSSIATIQLSAVRELAKRCTGEAVHRPLVHRSRADTAIHAKGQLVPVEHRPLHASIAFRDRGPRHRGEELPAKPPSSARRGDVEILEINPRAAEK